MFFHICFQFIPVVPLRCWWYAPHVELELPLVQGRALEWLVRPIFDGELHWRLHCSMINCFKDQFGQFYCSLIFKGDTHFLQSVSKALYSNTNRSMFHIRISSLGNRVKVFVYHNIQVLCNSLGYAMQFGVVICFCVFISKSRKGNRGEIANGNLILACIFNNFSA